MNESIPANTFEAEKSTFLPLLLLGVSFAFLLIFQVSMLLPQRELLQKVVAQNDTMVQQSLQVQASLQKLAVDLLAAAKDDKDAQAVIAKYGIQVNGASPVPAASPAVK